MSFMDSPIVIVVVNKIVHRYIYITSCTLRLVLFLWWYKKAKVKKKGSFLSAKVRLKLEKKFEANFFWLS